MSLTPEMNVTEADLMDIANALTPEQIAHAEHRIDNLGRITSFSFRISLGFLFGFAVITCTGRIVIRLLSRRRLFLDDAFLLFAFVTLAGGTGIIYKCIGSLYLQTGVLRANDPDISLLAFARRDELFELSKWMVAYSLFLWTTVFGVKWCYFAFFRTLLRSMSKTVTWYYRLAIAFSVLSWLFLVIGDHMITCPHVGKATAKCFPELPASKGAILALFWISPVLDGLTDLSIIIIPIIILRQSNMRSLTKIGLAVFLCLSVFMLACSITRACGIYFKGTIDWPWQVYWLHAEACIGVIMGSLTVYRSTLVGSAEVSDKLQSYLFRIFGREADIVEHKVSLDGNSRLLQLRQLPGATLTDLRTLFSRSNLAPTRTRDTDSDAGLVDIDYHDHIKRMVSESTLGKEPV